MTLRRSALPSAPGSLRFTERLLVDPPEDPAPREILVAGRLAAAPGLLDALAHRLARVAPVRPALAARSAARGAALLADGLAGGAYAPLVSSLRLRDARGGVLDHLRMYGAERIVLD